MSCHMLPFMRLNDVVGIRDYLFPELKNSFDGKDGNKASKGKVMMMGIIGWCHGWKRQGKGIYYSFNFKVEPDKLSPFIGTNPIILFILLLNFSRRISVDTFKIYIYLFLFIKISFVKEMLIVSHYQLP